jgi:membrane associated rhomboid family serine protease
MIHGVGLGTSGQQDGMFPIGDDNSQERSVPVVTYALVALNVAVFLLELSSGDQFIERWAFIPARFASNPAGNFMTIFTAMFMHGGWLHLLGNMLFLWIFGDNVEDRLGHLKFLFFYLLAGIAATLAQFALAPHSTVPNVGASGAIAGVLGAYILMFPKGRVNVLLGSQIVAMPAVVVLGMWILLQLFSGVGSIAHTDESANVGGVAYMAHIGGFAAGFLMAFLLRGTSPPNTEA